LRLTILLEKGWIHAWPLFPAKFTGHPSAGGDSAFGVVAAKKREKGT
jgi:hypothetical protein